MDIKNVLEKFNIASRVETRPLFTVTGEDKVWLVITGQLNLFLQENENSPLYPLTSISVGNIVHSFKMPVNSGHWQIVAKAGINAQILTVPLQDFFITPTDPEHTAALAAFAHHWVKNLAHLLEQKAFPEEFASTKETFLEAEQ